MLDQVAQVLERYMDVLSARQRLVASNVANADTPGYKTQGFDFEQEFARQLNGASGSTTAPRVEDVDGLVPRPDGNNVSMDREGMQLAKFQLQFRLGVELLKHEYSSVMSAIHAEAK